jgi:antitoxin ParD1/3/4
MSTLTLSFAQPEPMRSGIDERVKSGSYGNTGESLRELIRPDQEAQAAMRLRELIEEGLASGPPTPLTDADFAAIRERMLKAAQGTTA